MGLYTFFEDKWYDLIEWLNKYIPVSKIIDRIDGVIPSFLLFLILLLILFMYLGYLVISSPDGLGPFGGLFPNASTYDVGVKVSDKDGVPLDGVALAITMECAGAEKQQLTRTTNATGVANFVACTDIVQIIASKKNYLARTVSASFADTNVKNITLYLKSMEQRTVNVFVKNTRDEILRNATIDLVCTNGGTNTKDRVSVGTQSTNGFSISITKLCQTIELIGSALGYTSATQTLLATDTSKTFSLVSATGTGYVRFTIDSNIGKQNNAAIRVTDAYGEDHSATTNSSGQATLTLNGGGYTYTVTAGGYSKTGSFTVNASQTTEVNVFFESITTTPPEKNIYLKLMEGTEPVLSGKVDVYSVKDTNTSFFISLTTGNVGVVGPSPVALLDRNYIAVVQVTGFETSIVAIEPRTPAQGPQTVALTRGGKKLRVLVVDENQVPQANVQTILTNMALNAPFAKVQTDYNGIALYSSLPSGTYKISASNAYAQGAMTNISVTADTNITLVLHATKGNIMFLVRNEKALPVAAGISLYTKGPADTNFSFFETRRVSDGNYTTPSLTTGTEVYLEVRDDNYLPYTSLSYTILSAPQTKTIYVQSKLGLPNDNNAQLLFRQVYLTNPTVVAGEAQVATQILPGNTYYFLFDLVLNVTANATAYTRVYVNPDTNGVPDSNRQFFIMGAESIDSAAVILSSQKQPLRTDELTSTYFVDTNAYQANVSVSDQNGKKTLPLVVALRVAPDARGTARVYYQTQFKDATSLLYVTDFNIGGTFCVRDSPASCPPFLISNYLRRNNATELIPIRLDTVQPLYMGDTYELVTTVENTSAVDYNTTSLVLAIAQAGQQYVQFQNTGNLVNTLMYSVPSPPLTTSDQLVSTLFTKKASSAVFAIDENLSKMVNNVNTLRGIAGTGATMHYSVLTKNDLNISVASAGGANVLYGGTASLATIKTTLHNYMNGTDLGVSAHWKVTVQGTSTEIASGITDSNGEQFATIPLTAYPVGTVVVFTATDDNGSNPATRVITLTDAGSAPYIPNNQPTVDSCVRVKIGGVDTALTTAPYIPIKVHTTNTDLTLDATTCTEYSQIDIKTDIGVSPSLQYHLAPGVTQQLTLDATGTVAARNGLLGAYPFQVMLVDGQNFAQLAFIDIVVSDDESVFSLDNAIFDLSTTPQQSGTITNTKSIITYDAYYPQMEISTNAVNISYHKPGTPQQVYLMPRVTGHAIEVLVKGFETSSAFAQWGDSCCTVPADTSASLLGTTSPFTYHPDPSQQFYFTWAAQESCDALVSKYSEVPMSRPQPYSPLRDPTKPYDELTPEQKQQVTSGIFTFAEDTRKVSKASFANNEYPLGSYTEYSGVTNGKLPQLASQTATQTYETNPSGTQTSWGSGKDTCGGTHTLSYQQDGVAVEVPSQWYSTGYTAIDEGSQGFLGVPSAGIINESLTFPPCTGGVLTANNFYDSAINMGLMGVESGWNSGVTTVGNSCIRDPINGNIIYNEYCGTILNHEFSYVDAFKKERVATYQSVPVQITPQQGHVYDLGTYSATPTPRWGNIKTVYGHVPGQRWDDNAERAYEAVCVESVGFSPFEKSPDFNAPNVNDPTIEYDPVNPRILYKLEPASVPRGVRAFLKGGHIYAEYIGVQEADGPNIDFNITKVNLAGTQYAIITVTDWTSATTKATGTFQVKLIGNGANCYASDGTAGFTGPQFAPRLLFNWDWNKMTDKQCDTNNPNYTYCDATQFTISMFKRLDKIQNAIVTGNITALPNLATFSAYLIKDTYSQNFLDDFATYYDSAAFVSDGFVSSRDSNGYDQFIKQNKITYRLRNGSVLTGSGQLPMGGLYLVELEVNLSNPEVQSIVANGNPNADIVVTFTPLEAAKDYNPFYETPFDGGVGLTGTTVDRNGYGASVVGAPILLNAQGAVSEVSTSPVVVVQSDKNTLLAQLQSGIVLRYTKAPAHISFTPSQPTPVMMELVSAGGPAVAQYVITGFDANTQMQQTWQLVASSVSQNPCTDLQKGVKSYYTDTLGGAGKHTISFPLATAGGTLDFVTTFFSPKVGSISDQVIITPGMATATFKTDLSTMYTLPALTVGGANGSSINLIFLDTQGIKDFDTLQGIIDRVDANQMCISQNSMNELKVWWNPEYLAKNAAYIPQPDNLCGAH